jgi:hypothetical protein
MDNAYQTAILQPTCSRSDGTWCCLVGLSVQSRRQPWNHPMDLGSCTTSKRGAYLAMVPIFASPAFRAVLESPLADGKAQCVGFILVDSVALRSMGDSHVKRSRARYEPRGKKSPSTPESMTPLFQPPGIYTNKAIYIIVTSQRKYKYAEALYRIKGRIEISDF